MAIGWAAAARVGVARAGRLRAGSVLIDRGEFSSVIASLGADLADGPDLGALAAAFVLVTAITGPLATRALDFPTPARRPSPATPQDPAFQDWSHPGHHGAAVPILAFDFRHIPVRERQLG